VLGGSGTLGSAVCRSLVAAGADVAFTYRSQERVARQLVDQLNLPGNRALQADLSTTAETERVVDAALAVLGGIDAFVHCAAVGFTGSRSSESGQETIAEIDEAQFDNLFAVNVKSAFFACRRLVPSMRAQGGGDLVLIGSIDGVKPVPAPAHYGASKGALVGLCRTLAKELGEHGIRVNVVAPGVLSGGISMTLPSELRKEYLKHCGLKRFGEPAEVASIVTWLATANTYVTGQTILLDGAL
jgi:NAD(P)-dependent dehydrogenase (short-subunit alcohol dehydrogenase family)